MSISFENLSIPAETLRYLSSRTDANEPPEWFTQPWHKLTFEPFQIVNEEDTTVYIGNSGLFLTYTAGREELYIDFFPNGNPYPEFSSELDLQISNSKNFIYALYKTLEWMNSHGDLNLEKIKMHAEPIISEIIDKNCPPDIIDYKEHDPDYIHRYEYIIDSEKLINYIQSKKFSNSNLYKLIKSFERKIDSWPNMINPSLSAELIGDDVVIGF